MLIRAITHQPRGLAKTRGKIHPVLGKLENALRAWLGETTPDFTGPPAIYFVTGSVASRVTFEEPTGVAVRVLRLPSVQEFESQVLIFNKPSGNTHSLEVTFTVTFIDPPEQTVQPNPLAPRALGVDTLRFDSLGGTLSQTAQFIPLYPGYHFRVFYSAKFQENATGTFSQSATLEDPLSAPFYFGATSFSGDLWYRPILNASFPRDMSRFVAMTAQPSHVTIRAFESSMVTNEAFIPLGGDDTSHLDTYVTDTRVAYGVFSFPEYQPVNQLNASGFLSGSDIQVGLPTVFVDDGDLNKVEVTRPGQYVIALAPVIGNSQGSTDGQIAFIDFEILADGSSTGVGGLISSGDAILVQSLGSVITLPEFRVDRPVTAEENSVGFTTVVDTTPPIVTSSFEGEVVNGWVLNALVNDLDPIYIDTTPPLVSSYFESGVVNGWVLHALVNDADTANDQSAPAVASSTVLSTTGGFVVNTVVIDL